MTSGKGTLKSPNNLVKMPAFYALVLFASALEIPLGFVFDVSGLSLATFAVFVVAMCARQLDTVVTYIWYIVMAALTVVGVFACESGPVDLYEISKTGHYVNATSAIVLTYILFFLPIALGKGREAGRREIRGFTSDYGAAIAFVGLIVALLFEAYLVALVYDKPYFTLGVNRTDYAEQYLSGGASTIKGWLPMFIPCAVIVLRHKNKFLPAVFFVAMAFIYVWVGDKFGTYVFAISIVVYCVMDGSVAVKGSLAGKLLLGFSLACLALFVVGFAQRAVLYGEGLAEYFDFLLARLAQQGQIWWSVFDKTLTAGVSLDELPESFVAALTEESAKLSPYGGQWKMMLVASDYSSRTLSRVAASMPYTTTTQATLFFYFSWASMVFFPLLAVVCRRLIEGLLAAVRGGDCLVAMLIVKLIIAFNAVFTASELSALFSPVNIGVLVLVFLLTRQSPDSGSLAVRAAADNGDRGESR